MNPHTLLSIKVAVAHLRSKYSELDEDEQLRIDTIDGETDFKKAMSQLLREADEAAAFAEAMAGVIRDATQRRNRLIYREERRHFEMLSLLNAANLEKLPLPEGTLSIGRSRKVLITDQAKIPEDYIRTKREPNRAMLKVALKAGETVEGAVLSNPEPFLTVRR